MDRLVESLSLMPHGYCLLWNPWLLVLHGGADTLVFLSYFAIPIAIVRFLTLRPDVPFGTVGALFAAFILLCGLTHLLGVVTLFQPVYGLQGTVKLVTGLVSLATALVLFPLVPKLAALPRPAELTAANERLRAEAEAREATVAELERVRAGLEQTVDARTRELELSNQRLAILSREGVHRARNMLTVVQSIARQTAIGAVSKDELVEVLSGRIAAMGQALAIVAGEASGSVDLAAVVRGQLTHFQGAYPGRIEVDGPALSLPGEAAQPIGLAIYELATNAVKHGALKNTGRVAVRWRLVEGPDGRWLDFAWTESSMRPAPRPEAVPGFGFRLLTLAVPEQLQAEHELDLTDEGLHYRLLVPLAVRPHEVAIEAGARARLGLR